MYSLNIFFLFNQKKFDSLGLKNAFEGGQLVVRGRLLEEGCSIESLSNGKHESR